MRPHARAFIQRRRHPPPVRPRALRQRPRPEPGHQPVFFADSTPARRPPARLPKTAARLGKRTRLGSRPARARVHAQAHVGAGGRRRERRAHPGDSGDGEHAPLQVGWNSAASPAQAG